MSDVIHIDLGFVNAYLVSVGDGFILIDTGVAQQWNRLEAELRTAGCLPGKLKLIIITHGDRDHTGNCARLQREYQAKVAMHPADLAAVAEGLEIRHQARSFVTKIFLAVGNLLSGGNFETFRPDVMLEDGQGLEEYGLTARVIHTPGHTKGSIAVLTGDGQLFVGDTLANRTGPALSPLAEDFDELGRAAAALKSLKAVTVYPGHGKPFPFEALQTIGV